MGTIDANHVRTRWRAVMALCLVWQCLTPASRAVEPFHAPPQPAGSMEVKLYPSEVVTPGTPWLVTIGIPFPRGSLTAAGLSTVRVLTNGVEAPAHVSLLTPWRHLTDGNIDGQSVRVARVQLRHAFAAGYPDSESVTVEWGGAARSLDVPLMVDPLTAWHLVTTGTFVAADNVREPDVYAVLPKSVLARGVLNLRRLRPFADHIAETRDDPAALDAVEHWPAYEEADRAAKNNFYTSINADDPRVTTMGDGRLNPWKTDDEPWLYDRSSAFFLLYLRTGFLAPLREAVRSTEYYRNQLYGPAAGTNLAGVFRLKAPTPGQVTGGNTTMYSYAEPFAYEHWLTGNPQSIEPVRWVAATHAALTEPSRWSPALAEWTERHTAFRTLADLVAFELTGEAAHRQRVLTGVGDFLWHQNGAGGALPANRLDGGLYHLGVQHHDGVETNLVASTWMMSLVIDAMTRVYGVSDDPAVAEFVVRGARFQAATTFQDDRHGFDTAGAALRYPYYLAQHDGQPDPADGHDADAINHALEVATTVAWGAYFKHLLHGGPDPGLEAAARELYAAFDAGVNHWIRPAAPPLGLTAFRVVPWRKYAWEHRPGGSWSWVMDQIDTASPPPVVTLISPTNFARFTAPATLMLEATATAATGTIATVEFFAGSTLLGVDTTPPYSLQWTGVIQSLAGYTLTARARTTLGIEAVSPGVVIEVLSPTHPSLTVLNPPDGADFEAPATVTLQAEATPQAPADIARVIFMRNGVPVFTDTEAPYELTLTNLLAGAYDYEVRAFDVYGGYSIDFAVFTVTSPTPPTVALTAPAAGTTTAAGAVMRLSATAAAPGSDITRVEFLINGTPWFEVTSPPYAVDWSVPVTWPAGRRSVTARAIETRGGRAEASVEIELLDLPPLAIEWVSPAAGAEFLVPTVIQLEASANAPGSGITRVEFYANNQLVGIDTEAPFTAAFEPDVRQWGLVARAFDTLGRQAQATRTVHVTGVALPEVALTAPLPGAVLIAPAAVSLVASAGIPGTPGGIARVEFYQGGSLLGDDSTAPFSFTTALLEAGEYTFQAVATAAVSGRTAESTPVTVLVGAPDSPVVTLTSPRFPGPQVGTFTQVVFAASAVHTGTGHITRVEFLLDHAVIATVTNAPYEFRWEVGARDGYHDLQARAFDNTGTQALSRMVGFELIRPPMVTLTAPQPGTTVRPGTPRSISAAVTRGTYAIDRVEFLVDGNLVGEDTTAPYEVAWIPVGEGGHVLIARVHDTRGLSPESAPVEVTVGLTALDHWRFAHFATHDNSGPAADLADPDGDGTVNLLEWLLGGDPLAGIDGAPLAVEVDADRVVFTLRRADEAEMESTLVLQWSTDLRTWRDVVLGPGGGGPDAEGVEVTVEENGAAADRVAVSFPLTGSRRTGMVARLKGRLN